MSYAKIEDDLRDRKTDDMTNFRPRMFQLYLITAKCWGGTGWRLGFCLGKGQGEGTEMVER